tara:strand:- start:1198 stop:1668 length:471 start_codon:yes stop_codon:yes gene_type:complete
MVVGIINTSNQAQLNSFIAENSITFPIIFDPGSSGGVQGGDTYDLYYMPNDGSPYPRDFIIGQDGIIEYANNEIDTGWMLFIIEDLLSGGCSGWNIGDINNDTTVNVLDIITLINFILNVSSPDDCQYFVSDVNGDSNLNILDVVSMVNLIFGGPE